jgi:hypothetical protein
MVVYHDEENQPLMTDIERLDSDAAITAQRGDASPNANVADQSDAAHPDAPLDQVNTTTINHNSAVAATPGEDRASVPLEIDHDDTNNNSGTSTPRFLQDESTWKQWKWVPYPVRRVFKTVAKWSRGPVSPQPYRIRPFFPAVQEYPLRLADRFLAGHKRRFWVLFFYFSIWLVIFVLLKRQETLSSSIPEWGEPQNIGCGVSFWSADNGCNVNGNDCRPFNDSGFPFRCSAHCTSYKVLNPRAVGDQEIVYRPFIIGGPSNNDQGISDAIYRGDSYICGSAIHAGLFSNEEGGCGIVKLVGEHHDYVASNRNGISSIGFDSYFPLSYEFVPDIKCAATDMRWSILALGVVFTSILSLFTSSPALFFFPNFVGIFWTTGMSTDPPNIRVVAALFSNISGKFLPAMFVAWVMFDKMGVRRTLGRLTAQIEKTVLWLGPCWVGALNNYTLSFIPIQRLNAHDLQQQPGAKAALAIIILILIVIAGFQVWYFREEGRFLKYIKLYALFIGSIVIFLLIPGLNLRLHHYILALLLLPGTSLQTRPSLIYQGLLVGLFINGVARWGFDPVLQTSAALRGDAPLGSALPTILPPVIQMAGSNTGSSNITFSWEPTNDREIDGVSILVNDVERFRTYFEDSEDHEATFTWTREADLGMPEYFRFAFVTGSVSGDYTKAGTWTKDGGWIEMGPGPSKAKVRSLDGSERFHIER